MAKKEGQFNIVDRFWGYVNKIDESKVSPGFLVAGSRNVLINEGNDQRDGRPGDKIYGRKGYSVYGDRQSGVAVIDNGIDSKYDFKPNLENVERTLRAYQGATANTGRLETYYDGTWIAVETGLTSTVMSFINYWDATDSLAVCLIADGTSTVKEWTGAIGVIDSASTNTVTLASGTWAELNFFQSGTRKFSVDNIDYTYTGGESTDTLTGVTPDPDGVLVQGDIAVQTLRSNSNIPGSGFNVDYMGILDNQVYYGSKTSNLVYMAKGTNFTDVTFTTPVRAPNEGNQFLLDDVCAGFAPGEEDMYIFSGSDYIYRSNFTLTGDGTKEVASVKRLKVAPGQSALTKDSIIPIKNDIAFITHEKTLDTLGRLENINTPRTSPISDPVKNDFLTFTLTGASSIYFRQNIWIALPNEGLVLIFDIKNGRWQPPQNLPLSGFSIIGDEIYGHSSTRNETYKLNDTYQDNGLAIEYKAIMSYQNNGTEEVRKQFDEFYVALRMSANGEMQTQIDYEFRGALKTENHTVEGTETAYQFAPSEDSSLGSNPIGSNPLGQSVEATENKSLFRKVHTMNLTDYHEYQVTFLVESDETEWELLRFGDNAVDAEDLDNYLRD